MELDFFCRGVSSDLIVLFRIFQLFIGFDDEVQQCARLS